MELEKKAIYNLANVFFVYYKDTDLEKQALSILKIFDIDYNKKLNNLIYEKNTPFIITREDLKDYHSTITPVSLLSFDIECIETVLNKVDIKPIAIKLSPIFDCIGWVLRLDVDMYRIHYIVSPTYEYWKEPYISWDDDIEDNAIDWRSGNDWRDGFDLSKNFPPNWKNFLEND